MNHYIEKEPLPLFLHKVYLNALSGHLFVTCSDFQFTLYFQDGKLVSGMSTRFDEKISVILNLMGIINEEQYNFLSDLRTFSDDQVIEILLSRNFAKKKDIYYARIYQLRRIAISIFSLQRGKWIFTAGEPEPPLREIYEIPLAGILVEGARAIDHASFYSNLWLHHVPVLFKEIPLASEIYFTDQERAFYASVLPQAGYSCQALIARLNIFPIDFWRNVLAFHLLGIIAFEKSGGTNDMARDIAALLELNRKMQALVVDFPRLLGLTSGASVADFEKVRTEYLDRFSPQRFGSAAAPEIKNIAQQVCQRLQALKVRLDSKPVLTEKKPVRKISPQIEPVPAKKTPDMEFFPQIEPVLADEVLEREFIPQAAPPAATVADSAHEKAWELLLRSKELYERREFANAIPLLKQAIKLEPGQGDFYYLLGLCQSKVEIMENEAEINLKKAIEFKSWSSDPVYALGILYRRQGKMNLAERCFQRVKEIAYDHTGAGREMANLRRLRSGGKSKTPFLKKKIF